MTSNLPSQVGQVPNLDQAAAMTASLRASALLRIRSKAEADQVSEAVRALSIPATKQWISGRVATVLSQYYVSSVPSEMMKAVAEDWHYELRDFPSWAINKACRWWMGRDNPKRRQKPVPGDIAQRADFEMAVVRVSRRRLERFGEQGPSQIPDQSRERVSAEAASEIMKSVGIKPKRFGGQA